MNYNKQYSVFHESNPFKNQNTIRIFWDLLYICNLECNYCYARRWNNWNKLSKNQEYYKILKQLNNIPEDLELVLLGGEPTLFPNLSNFINKAFLQIEKLKSLTVISNLNTKFNFEKIASLDKKYTINWNVSFHSNYTNKEIFYSNLKDIIFFNINLSINIIIDESPNKSAIIELIQFCKQNNILYIFNVIFDPDNTNIKLGNLEFIKELQLNHNNYKELVFESNSTKSFFSDLDTSILDLNNFNNWTCYNNNFELKLDNNYIKHICSKEKIYLDKLNNIKKQYSIICKEQKCQHQGLLGNEKIKNIRDINK